MIVTAKLRYALELLTALGHHDPAEPLSLREVAQASSASEKYLETVAAELRKGGIVVSRKGKAGGYFLARPAREIAIEQIVDACEPELLATPAGMQTTGGGPPGAGQEALWLEVRARLRGILGEYRLSDLVDGRFSEGEVLNYVI